MKTQTETLFLNWRPQVPENYCFSLVSRTFCALSHAAVQDMLIVFLILLLFLYNASVHERSNDLTRPDDSGGGMKNCRG